jgi:murein DD-endopeptidase MepM/ murein hydrolase activator NlpD
MLRHFAVSLVCLLQLALATPAGAADTTYTVQTGDSFSSIAAKVLNDASRWREIWALNPEIRTPTQLKAGQRIRLPAERPTAASPPPPPDQQGGGSASRSEPGAAGIVALAREAIDAGWVARAEQLHRLMSNTRIDQSPRLHQITPEAGLQRLYVSKLPADATPGQPFGLFLPRKPYAGLSTTWLRYVGKAQLTHREQDRGKFTLLERSAADLTGAVLLPLETTPPPITPSRGERPVSARIVAVSHELPPGYLVVIDQGRNGGLQRGHLLVYYKKDYLHAADGKVTEFPTDTAGVMLVVQTTHDASLALVLRARQVPAIGDRVSD